MTRIYLKILLFMILSVPVLGQTDKTDIETAVTNYMTLLEEQDNVQAVEYLYPKFFDTVPKEMILNAMEQMKADTTTQITFGNSQVGEISDIFVVDSVKYAIVNYTFDMTMIIKMSEEEKQDTTFNVAEFTYSMFKEQYGEENVQFDKDLNKIDIHLNNQLFAINDPEFKGWKFLEKKENMMQILETILPKEVLEHFK